MALKSFLRHSGAPPISGLPEIGTDHARVGNSRPAWREPGATLQDFFKIRLD
jgi:hypothetical protein